MRTPQFPDVEGQFNLATRRQLTTAGFTRAAVRHASQRDWHQVRPGVFVPHRGPLDADTRLAAAALWAGPHAVLTGALALHRHGIRQADTSEAVFLVPATARSRRDGRARTIRSARQTRVALHVGCVMVVPIERALLDLANHGDERSETLQTLTLACLQQRRTTPARVEDELQAAPRRGTAPVRRAVELYRRGAWSLPEASLAELVAADDQLPPMLQNVPLRSADGRTLIGVPDGFFPDAGVAVQVHSRQFHSGYDEEGTDLWSMTVEGDGIYPEHDVICLGVTPRSIHRRAETTLARIRSVVLRNLGRSYAPVLVGDELCGDQDAAG